MANESRQEMTVRVADVCSRQRADWCRGEFTRVEQYLAEHVELETNDEALLDLIYNEIFLREEQGDSVTLQEYCCRFPALIEQLQDLWQVHQAINSEKWATESSIEDESERSSVATDS